MTPSKPKAKRRLGFLAGQIGIPDDFDRMYADEILALFEGEDVPAAIEAETSSEDDTE